MSIIVANRLTSRADIGPSVSSLRHELLADDEVVWVDAGGVDPRLPDALRLEATSGANRGELYGTGLASATRDLVAFTDSSTELAKGWRTAADGALTAGAKVVGGPVLPRVEGLASMAGFLVEYGPHSAPPFTSANGDVAANNVAYRRSVLEQVVVPGAPLWKNVVNATLTEQGVAPRVVPAMAVVSTKTYGWRDLGPVRAAHGRLYAAQRAQRWSRARRLAAALACVGLPALAFARLASRTRTQPQLRRLFARAAPLVALALAAWSVGEAWGYLSPGEGRGVF